MIIYLLNICMNIQNLTGQLIVAPPKIVDRRFNNTVIYINSHTPAGAWGLVINKPITGMSNKDILERVSITLDLPGEVHAGGPVNSTSLHFLHTPDICTMESQHGGTGLAVSSDMGFVNLLIDGNLPKKYRLILGACSWGPGQLEGELAGVEPWSKEHSWLIAPIDNDIMFNLTGMDLWRASVELSAKSAVSEWMS